MEIKCYGSRGSVPVSGEGFEKYGGNTTCLKIIADSGDIIIVDAGTGIRKVGNELLQSKITTVNILFTHAHWDHLLGFPFFKPLYNKKFNINIYGCPFMENNSTKDMISGTMVDPYTPVKLETFSAKINYYDVRYSAFEIGSIKIIPINLSHPNQGIGYKFVEGDKQFVFLTDNELGYQHPGGLEVINYVHDCLNVDILFHDGEYLPTEYPAKKTWGHSTYEQATELAIQAKVKILGLVHHNQDRTDAEIDQIVLDCNRLIKKNHSNLNCFAVSDGAEITL